MEMREHIIELHKQGLSYGQIAKALEVLKFSKNKSYLTVKCFKETGSLEDHPRRVHTTAWAKAVREKIRRSKQRSMRKIAMESGMSTTTMIWLVKDDLGRHAYHIQKMHLLSEATKAKRLERSRKLLELLMSHTPKSVVWSDEKLCNVEAAFNSKNNCVLAKTLDDIPLHERTVFRCQKPASIMVSCE